MAGQEPQGYQFYQTEQTDQRMNLRKMETALSGQGLPPSPKLETNQQSQLRPANKPMAPLDIAMIGAAPFHQHLAKRGSEAFITSLSEIDHVIQEKQGVREVEPDEEELVQQLLPKQY